MRRIVLISMLSIDGVLQAPGGPDEDRSGGFEFGGWTASFGDEEFGQHFGPLMGPADLLLGRWTYDNFAGYWPQNAEFWPGINDVTKFVVSTSLTETTWSNSVILTGVDDIQRLKESEGGELHVWGSSELAQTLFEHDLVDELALVTYPVTLGRGKRLFGSGTIPAAYTVSDAAVTPQGVVFARYTRAGAIEVGTVGP